MLRAVRGAGKDNPLAEIIAFMRLWRAFPRTSSQMSCWFLFPVRLFWGFLVDSAPGYGREVWGTSKSPLGSSCSGHQSLIPVSSWWNNLTFPADPLPPELERAASVSCSFRATQGSSTRILSPLIFPVQSLTLVVTIRSPSFVVGVYEGKSSTLSLSHQYLILIHSGGLLHRYKHTGCWFICS